MTIQRSATAVALSLTAALALAGCAGGGSMSGMDHGSGSAPSASASAGAEASEADVMFVSMMIPHHEQAIEMSDTLLAKDGIDQRVTALAEQITDAQESEIAQMQEWLSEWGASTSDDMGGMDHGGMMSESDMTALEDAEGEDAARLFLEQMVEHHEGAVDMAEDEVDDGRNSDAVDLARTIVDTQTAEIDQMNELLGQL
ncbi:DUF305 domain-containing protein [Microbacterium sp. HMH0099]|uniref:DUF305 domain-containing protein n=1 Tax=Microbacterium sp. HMH0099 TaxID=3414026 RepID=UPI003BF656FE